MPEGGQLIIYTPDNTPTIGPFTQNDNKPHHQLWTPIVLGDEVVLEVTIPENTKPQLQLELTTIDHGYR